MSLSTVAAPLKDLKPLDLDTLRPWDCTASASLETNFWPCFYWQLTGWKDEPLKECGKTRANYHGNRMATWKDYCQKPWPKIMAKEYMFYGWPKGWKCLGNNIYESFELPNMARLWPKIMAEEYRAEVSRYMRAQKGVGGAEPLPCIMGSLPTITTRLSVMYV